MLAERITSPSFDLSSPKVPTPLESSKSTRFHQNTRDLVPKRISDANRVGTPNPHRFLYPVFSWPYKTLLQQPLSFHIYTKRGACGGHPASNQNGKASGTGSNADDEKSTGRY